MTDPVTAASAASAVVSTAATTPVYMGFWGAFAGFVAGWAVVILLVILALGILSEHNDSSGWSVFFMLIAGVVAYMAFSVSWTMLAVYSVSYVLIGLFWSFWRYKRHAAMVVERHKNSDSREKQYALQRLHPKAMLGTITAWILVWPFSFIQNLLSDLITAIQSLVTKIFRGIYHKIYDAAVAALQ